MNGAVAALKNLGLGSGYYQGVSEITRAMKPLEPAYLFSESCLHERVQEFKQGFPGAISYAVKANPEPRIIRALAARAIEHFDVASLGEIKAVRSLCPGATLHFNNPVKPLEAIEAAYHHYRVRSFALDERAELDKIQQATGGDRSVLYSVRFRLAHGGASYDFGSKFGTSPEQAADLLRDVVRCGARPALTFHPGSQCTDPQMYYRYLYEAARIIRLAGVNIEQINVGGGFPEYYDKSPAPALGSYFETIKRGLVENFSRAPRLMCEPGRAMVASSVSLLTRVIHVRDDGRTIFLNDGVYGGMQEQSIVDLHLPVRVWRGGRALAGESITCHVFGPTCDPVDRLSREIELPRHLQTGDYLEFGLLGAYGSATSTRFNGFCSTRYFNVASGFRNP